jgi:hypothetical protein
MMESNETKEKILERLHKYSAHCIVCGRKKCAHSSRKLPSFLKTDDVLRAINYEDYFGEDEVE